MIEKQTVWAVTSGFKIIERVAIVENDKVLVSRNPNEKDTEFGWGFDIIRYFMTEEKAKEWVEGEEKTILDMVQKVRNFINRLDYQYELREKLGIKKSDYLGSYSEEKPDRFREGLNAECDYAKKLEVFIKSRMLNIDGRMIPIDQVREIQWYAVEDVRLIWATIGKCISSWFIDNDIDYDKSDDDDK